MVAIECVGVSRCKVSYRDMQGVEHCADVDAESLYEAIALAVSEFRDDNLVPDAPGLMTEFTVAILRKPVEHRLRLKQVHDWAQPSVQGGPAGITRRERVRKLLAGGPGQG